MDIKTKMEGWESDSCFLPPEVPFDLDHFRHQMISQHNHYRRMHASPPLTSMPDLQDNAQAWAENIAARGYLQYCELPHVGENICALLGSEEIPSGQEVVRKWYKEIKYYSFTEPRWRRGAFHFTQMIWKSTTHIGIGVAPVPGQAKWFLVTRYFPAGNSNMPGKFHKNVIPRVSPPSESIVDDSFMKMFYGRLRSFTVEDAFV